MQKFDVLNKLNDGFKQRVKILYMGHIVFQDYKWDENINQLVLKG